MKFFSPKTQLRKPKPFFTIDIETYTLRATKDSLWFGCIYGHNYRAVFNTQLEFFKIIKHDRFKGSIIYAHNGGKFDFLVLFGNLLYFDVVYNKSRFIFLRYNDIIFADSLNFFKTSVKVLGELIGIKKGELNNIGEIKRGTKPSKLDIEYCYRDCEIIYEALAVIFEQSKPALTIGSLAMDVYQRNFLHNKLRHDKNIEKQYLKAYFGGRTEAFQLGKVNCEVYDINSMYPYVMKHIRFPHPSYSFKRIKPKLNWAVNYINCNEGMFSGKIKVPETLSYMPLPTMTERLIFPSGVVSGCWCINEVRNALKHGCKLVSCNYILGSSRIIIGAELFSNFVDHFYKSKNTSTGILREFYKLVLNNLYGKFGQHNYTDSKYFETKDEAIKWLKQKKDYYNYELKYYNKTRNDCYIERVVENFTAHSIISFASYITAEARIKLFNLMIKYKPIYVDTDSLFIPVINKLKPKQSNKLGLLKKEDYLIKHIAGCKSYTRKVNNKPGLITKIKGIPAKAERVGLNSFKYKMIVTPKTAMRRNLDCGELIEVTKTITNNYKKGAVNNNLLIKPFHIKNNIIIAKRK